MKEKKKKNERRTEKRGTGEELSNYHDEPLRAKRPKKG